MQKEIRVITKGLDVEEYFDPSKSWRDNETIVYGSLIVELVELLPPIDGRAVTRVEIEEILKTAHRNQRSKYQKSDPAIKALQSRRIRRNNRNFEASDPNNLLLRKYVKFFLVYIIIIINV